MSFATGPSLSNGRPVSGCRSTTRTAQLNPAPARGRSPTHSAQGVMDGAATRKDAEPGAGAFWRWRINDMKPWDGDVRPQERLASPKVHYEWDREVDLEPLTFAPGRLALANTMNKTERSFD